jgi:hypothetical protein
MGRVGYRGSEHTKVLLNIEFGTRDEYQVDPVETHNALCTLVGILEGDPVPSRCRHRGEDQEDRCSKADCGGRERSCQRPIKS